MRAVHSVLCWLAFVASMLSLTSARLVAQNDPVTDVAVQADFDGNGSYDNVTFGDLAKTPQVNSGGYSAPGCVGWTWERSGDHIWVYNASGQRVWRFDNLGSNSNAGVIRDEGERGVGNWKK